MTTAETSAPAFDPSHSQSAGGILRKWVAPFAVGIALLSAFLTFMVLSGLTPIEPTRNVVYSFLLINAATILLLVGIISREVWLVIQARRRGRAAARLHVQIVGLVLRHRRVAGRAGGDRRQRHHRPRPRPAVLGADPRGDAELADRGPRLHLRTRAADPRRHPGNGQRHCPCPSAVRPGPAVVPRVSDPKRRLPQSAGRHADRQGSQHPVGSADRHQTGIHDAAAGVPEQRQRRRAADRGLPRGELCGGGDPAALLQRHLPVRGASARSARGRAAQADRSQRRRICPDRVAPARHPGRLRADVCGDRAHDPDGVGADRVEFRQLAGGADPQPDECGQYRFDRRSARPGAGPQIGRAISRNSAKPSTR